MADQQKDLKYMVFKGPLRQPSTGLIERNEELGLEKYAKPAGIIASLIPMTNPANATSCRLRIKFR